MINKERLNKIIEFARQEVARKATKFNPEYFTGQPEDSSGLISLRDLEWAVAELAKERDMTRERLAIAIEEFANNLEAALLK